MNSKSLREAEIERRFNYHPPKPTQHDVYSVLRAEVRRLAHILSRALPESGEKDLALIKLEEAMFHANASVARYGTVYTAGMFPHLTDHPATSEAKGEKNPAD